MKYTNNIKSLLSAVVLTGSVIATTSVIAKAGLTSQEINTGLVDSSNMGSVSIGEANRGGTAFQFGFEPSEGFNVGHFSASAVAGFAQFTSIEADPNSADSTTSPLISTSNGALTNQHLRLNKSTEHAQSASGASVRVGIITSLPNAPNFTDKNVFELDYSVTEAGGSDYAIRAESRGENALSWIFDISFQNDYRIVDDVGNGLEFVNPGAQFTWVVNQKYHLKIETDPSDGANGSIKYYIDGTLIYTGVAGLFGGKVADNIIFYNDNFQSATEFGDFDNYYFDPAFVAVLPDPDVSLTKTNDAVGQLNMNDTVNYTLTVSNTSTGPASNVVLVDTLPSGITYASSSCTDGSTGSLSASNVTFNLADMAVSATTTCTVVASVTDFGSQVNNAVVTADNDTDTNNNSANSTVTGPASPTGVDLAMTKTSNASGQVAENATVVYTLSVTNIDASNTATSVVVTDSLPAQVTYVSNDCGATNSSGTVTWNVGSLAPSANSTCNVTVTVTGFGDFDNTATATAAETDNVSSNDSATASVMGPTPAAGVDLALSVSVNSPSQVFVGDTLIYTLSLSNLGTIGATNTIVSNIMSSSVQYNSNNCGASRSGNTVTWNVGSLTAGSATSCDITVTVSQEGSIFNIASATSNEIDIQAGNNTSSVAVSSGVQQIIPSLNWMGILLMILTLGFFGRRLIKD